MQGGISKFLAVGAVLAFVVGVSADTLTVNGTVSDAAQNPIAGASVSLSIGGPGGLDSVSGTTDAAGAFSLTMDNAAGQRFAVLSASAAGYTPGVANVNVNNSDDGVADTVSRDITLQALQFDTVSVTATVDDGATAIQGARVILSYLNEVDTVSTDASGQIAQQVITTQQVGNVDWIVEADGYESQSGTQPVAVNVADLGTVSLTAYTSADTLTYTVSGSVTDEQGGGLRNETVVMTYASGTTVLASDTVQSGGGRGNYNSEAILPYQAGNITVTVSVAAAGYAPFTQSVIVPTSTTDIDVDAPLTPDAGIAAWASKIRTSQRPDRAVVFTLDGRRVAVLDGASLFTGSIDRQLRMKVRQPLVVRWYAGQAVAGSQLLVPVR